jgi:hypothetical protein
MQSERNTPDTHARSIGMGAAGVRFAGNGGIVPAKKSS